MRLTVSTIDSHSQLPTQLLTIQPTIKLLRQLLWLQWFVFPQAEEKPRALRSAVQAIRPVGLVLPQKCVICHREKFYTRKNHLTVEHNLIKASTMAAGWYDAATQRTHGLLLIVHTKVI